MEHCTNTITIRGQLQELPMFSHETHGRRFYRFFLEIPRLSGTLDILPVIAEESVLNAVDLSGGESIPPEILSALTDETVLKTAFHAMFERVCLSRYLGLPSGTFLDPSQWRCTMVWAATLGLPMSLNGVGQALQLEHQKMQ